MYLQLYLLLVKERVFSNPLKAERIYIVIGFVLPFLPVLAGLIAQVHAPAGVWYGVQLTFIYNFMNR